MTRSLKKTCVVLDTNIWVSSRILRDPMGATLLYYINMMKGKIGMPEVIENEIIKNVTRLGINACDEINNNYRLVQMIMGKITGYDTPNESELRIAIEKRLKELDTFFERVIFTL